jgi:gliding motility-associated-like protein
MNKLDGFDKLIKDSLENFEMEFDASQWTAFEQALDKQALNTPNDLDGFEGSVKNSLDKFEAPYDPTQWTRLESALGNASKPFMPNWMIAASSVGVIAGGVLLYSIWGSDNEQRVNDANQNTSSEVLHASSIDKEESEVKAKEELLDLTSEKSEHSSSTENVSNPKAEKEILPNVTKVNDGSTPHSTSTDGLGVELNKLPESKGKGNGTLPGIPVLDSRMPSPSIVHEGVSVQSIQVCLGTDVKLIADNAPAGARVFWEVDKNGVSLVADKFNYHFSEVGMHTVRVVFEKNGITSTSTEIQVQVKELPEVNFSYDLDRSSGYPIYQFTSQTTNAVSYHWNFGNGQSSSELSPSYYFRSKGEYGVTLTATGANGCQAQHSEKIEITENYNLLAPNAFSPNGDGVNETFIPEALKAMNDVQFTMTIYDRNGKLVYSTNAVNRPWDGRYMSENQPAPAGAYVWKVQINGEEDAYMGTVTLIW